MTDYKISKDSEKELKMRTRPYKDGIMVVTEKRGGSDLDVVCDEVR